MELIAVIFDHDGLTVDSEIPHYRFWQEIYANFGFQLTLDRWASGVSQVPRFDPLEDLKNDLGSLGRALDSREESQIREQRRAWSRKMIDQIDALPGIQELIQDLINDVPVALATNGRPRRVKTQLQKVDLYDRFSVIVTAEGVLKPESDLPDRNFAQKPDPAVYMETLRLLGVPPEKRKSVVALEDSREGCEAAKTAGLTVVVVRSAITQRQDLSMADLIVDTAQELTLKRLNELLTRDQSRANKPQRTLNDLVDEIRKRFPGRFRDGFTDAAQKLARAFRRGHS
jgi:beta-phosphoglucomutase-like phosphatase (HAD superfamily)